MPKAKKTKTYSIEVTGQIEVAASFKIKATSESEAIAAAEDQFENEIECSIYGAEDVSSVSVQQMDSTTEEQD